MFSGSATSLQVQAAFDMAVRKYGGRPQVTGIDVGYKWKNGRQTKTVAVRIHVREKYKPAGLALRERLPKVLNGVPVDVIEAEYASELGHPLQSRVDTLRPGVSVGRVAAGGGTLGMFVSDNRAGGKVGLLSAAHVLFAIAGVPGDAIIQAGRDDGGVAADVVATITRAFRPSDAALATLTGDRDHDPSVALSAVTLTAPREPRLGDVLEKCGRTTEITRARVDGIGHHMGLQNSFRLVGLDDNPIADFGDSGAIWYDPATGAVVGLHCKGPITFTPSANFAIATRLTLVMSRLDVSLV